MTAGLLLKLGTLGFLYLALGDLDVPPARAAGAIGGSWANIFDFDFLIDYPIGMVSFLVLFIAKNGCLSRNGFAVKGKTCFSKSASFRAEMKCGLFFDFSELND